MNVGGAIGLVAVTLAALAGLAAAATFIALGVQRGRVERLEKRNEDLEHEVDDEKRRHSATRDDLKETREELADAVARGIRQQSVIDHLTGEVEVMSRNFQGVEGPLHEMQTAIENLTKMVKDLAGIVGDRRGPGG